MVDVEFDVELSMVHSWQYHAEYLYQNYESILVIAIAYSYMHCAAGSRHALHGMTKLCSDQIFDFIFQIKYSRRHNFWIIECDEKG